MATYDEEFIKRLRATFQVEAEEHLQAIGSALLKLEKATVSGQRQEAIETMHRAAHSLKGASRAVDLTDIEKVCQALEEIFSALKRGQLDPSPAAFDTMHQAVDTMGSLLAPATSKPDEIRRRRDDIIHRLHRILSEKASGSAPKVNEAAPAPPPPIQTRAPEQPAMEPPSTLPPPRPEPVAQPAMAKPVPQIEQSAPAPSIPPAATLPTAPPAISPTPPIDQPLPGFVETVRIPTAKLEACLLEAEEMLTLKPVAAERAADLRDILAHLAQWKKEWARVLPEVRALRQEFALASAGGEGGGGEPSALPASSAAGRLVNFLDWSSDYVGGLEARLGALASNVEHDRQHLGKLVDNLLEDSKRLLMLPFSSLSEMLPKIVRDLCRDQGKEAELIIRGGEIEIDKRILEEMKDPFIHILRNAIDHGIEKPEFRSASNKPRRATITIDVSQVNGSKAQILVTDDGAGIDTQKVRDAVSRQGILPRDKALALNDREATAYILHSGVSTSPIITEISGRGLGAAILRSHVVRLGGEVSIESSRGVGTTFKIVIPLTLATFRGVFVRCGERLFVVPRSNVDQVLRVRTEEIRTVENRETISIADLPFSLARLEAVLELPPQTGRRENPSTIPIVVLASAGQRIAFAVDEILHEEDVLVKQLRKPMVRVRNVSGVTALGSGKTVPVLNVADLLRSAKKYGVAPEPSSDAGKEHGALPPSRRILIVEDSITSRMLIKGILESAGYQVKTAVDGLDGFSILRQGEFDLVVSDVEMPRLNGFDLTARIRSDPKFAHLPVILVTALESREERERGIDAGANAYIIKSSFDQSNLLEVVRRLT